MDEPGLWKRIYEDDLRMMRDCDIIVANLTPFRGASADAGTLVELGWFLGAGKPCWGYSNCAKGFAARTQTQLAAIQDALPGIAVEDFGLADNLMIEGALAGGLVLPPDGISHPFDSLEVFERCLRRITG
jgi:nucleoside 2-deoxyribosyltransferase